MRRAALPASVPAKPLSVLVPVLVSLLAALLVSAGPAAADDPPPNPSDAQIAAAEQAKQDLAIELGSLQAQAVQLQAQIVTLQASADAAIAEYQRTTRAVLAAVAAADAAKAALATANQQVADATRSLQAVAHDTFVTGSTIDPGAALLFSDSADVEFTLAAATYLGAQRDATVSSMTKATVAAANADSTRRTALAEAVRLQKVADEQQAAAVAAVGSAQGKASELQTTLDDVNERAAQAAAALSGLQDQRAAYDAYLAEVARKAAAAEAARRAQAQRQAEREAAAAAAANRQVVYVPVPQTSAPSGTWALPLRTYSSKSSNYGYRCISVSCGFHYGVDIAAPEGTPMYAVGPGTVVASGPATGFGNWVVIRHEGGSYSVYGHMRVLVARVGQQVTSSTLIAYVGSEGQSTGAHLHFEVRIGSYSSSTYAVNPIFWLAARGIDF